MNIPEAALHQNIAVLGALNLLTENGSIRVTTARAIPMWVLLRSWHKVELTETCWLFRGKARNGYQHCAIEWAGNPFFVHRIVWALCNGPIPDGMVIRHRCDVGNCIKPEHLLLGTQLDNIADMNERGRAKHPPTMFGQQNPKVTTPDSGVLEMRAARAGQDPPSLRALAARYGVSQSTAFRWTKGQVRA